MPFTRVSVNEEISPEQKQAIAHSVHQAMVDNIGLPQDDFFPLISEYKSEDFIHYFTF